MYKQCKSVHRKVQHAIIVFQIQKCLIIKST